jgi:CheY-like chemotaxis protein/DNA-binding transcriptional ArsR family regulator
MKKILIVDDDKELRANLAEIMAGAGYAVDMAATGGEAVEKAIAEDFDLVLLDLIMPRMSGSDVLAELRRVCPRARIIMITAFATIDNAVDAIKRGASDYVPKPFKIDNLLTRIRRVLEEASFDACGVKGDLDCILSSLSNPIRRKIIHLISVRQTVRLMELVRELEIQDHTKVIFHVKILREAGIVEQNSDRSYVLTKDGDKTLHCLKMLEVHLASFPSK